MISTRVWHKRAMKIFGMCIDWRVVAVLGAVAVAIGLTHPAWLLVAGPFLLFALCPLSMFFMMRMMGGGNSCSHGGSNASTMSANHGSDTSEPTITVPLSVWRQLSESGTAALPPSPPTTALRPPEHRNP